MVYRQRDIKNKNLSDPIAASDNMYIPAGAAVYLAHCFTHPTIA